MSQQGAGAGADDWWQKLYEDPEPGPEPDPRDTLDHRFRSAAVMVTEPLGHPPATPPAAAEPAPAAPFDPEPGPAAAAEREQGRGPDAGTVPGQRRESGRAPTAGPEPGPAGAFGWDPEGGSEWGPGPGAGPRSEPDPGPAYPGSDSGSGTEPDPGIRPGSAESLLPPPRDPREGGQTWYALGDVAVPPALPAEEPGELPVWRRRLGGDAPAAAAIPKQGPVGPEPGSGPGPQPAGGSGPDEPSGGSGPDEPAGPDGPGGSSGRAGPGGQAVRSGPDGPASAGGRGGATVPDPAGSGGAGDGARSGAGSAADPAGDQVLVPPRPVVTHLGDRPPTYAAEPVALPAADPAGLDTLTPDTVLEGAQYGGYTLRAASLRGDSARFRGEARRDFLLTARFGAGPDALVLVVLAGGDRAASGAGAAAAEVCRLVASAVGRSQERLAEDIRAGRRDALRSGLQRLTDRGYGRLRARAAELGLAKDAYTAGLRGLLLPVDPECHTRVCFGAGAGGLFRLRGGQWRDLEEAAPPAETGFRFRASVARPGDTLLLCSGGLAEPMREEQPLSDELAARWSEGPPPGLAAFLADTQLRLKGYADDRTAAAVWEA